MDLEQFRVHSENFIAYIVHFMETMFGRSPDTEVYKKYLQSVIPKTAPSKGESLDRIMDDLEKHIMPGLNLLHPPGCNASRHCSSPYPSILAEMLEATFGCENFNWNICPSGKELESIVLDWYGKMIGLPVTFLQRVSKGGCVVQGTISESIITCMLSACQDVFKRLSRRRFTISRPLIVAFLVAYCTKEAKHIFQDAITICMVNLRILDTDENFCLRADTLSKAVEEDKAIGFMPFFVNITLGNIIGTCDSLHEIGIVCEEHGLWLNVDALHAGNALVCPEYRHYIEGIEYVTSFSVNPRKWLIVHPDSVLLFVTDLAKISDYVIVNTTMYNYGPREEDWSLDNKRTFIAFQLWVNIRSYGIDGFKKHVRNHFQQAELFKKCMVKDERFSVLNCNFGRVCFRLKGSNDVNESFLRAINTSGKLFLDHIVLEEIFVICFDICSESASEDHIETTWNIIKELADRMLEFREDS